MKTNILKLAAVLLMVAGIAACGEKENTEPFLDNVTYSLCNNVQQNSLVALQDGILQNGIKYTTLNNQTLQIEQWLVINCCCERISVEMLSNENDIVIDVCDYGNQCNCPCQGNVSYNVSGLQKGTTYSFTFKRNDDVRYTTSITFTDGLNQTINF